MRTVDGSPTDDEECQKFQYAFEAFEKEVKGHDIYGLLERAKKKLVDLPSKLTRESSALRKKVHDYTRYIEAYEETKKIYEKFCHGEKHKIKCETILEAHDVWHEEIHKYKVGWLKYYKKLNAIYDEMIKKHCGFE